MTVANLGRKEGDAHRALLQKRRCVVDWSLELLGRWRIVTLCKLRAVVQLGRTLEWGSRGRGFKPRQPDFRPTEGRLPSLSRTAGILPAGSLSTQSQAGSLAAESGRMPNLRA